VNQRVDNAISFQINQAAEAIKERSAKTEAELDALLNGNPNVISTPRA
jgi:hypothetical protein